MAAVAARQEAPLINNSARAAKRAWRRYAVISILITVSAVGVYQALWRYHLKRFDAVAPGVLYRSAQPTAFGMRHLIHHHGVKTVVSLRREDSRLKTWSDFSEADGPYESEYVEQLDRRFLHWQLGGEEYWPWLSPKLFEAYFQLMDDPANLPVAVHCVGGRHRTGTFAALYRLEYERWPVSRVLQEMYSYNFGGAVPIHEHNLRTYRVRPRPSLHVWQQLASAFAEAAPVDDYDDLVRRIRGQHYEQDVQSLKALLEQGQPFAICLAERVIDCPTHPVVPAALERAKATLRADDAPREAWASAAALIADWGCPELQQWLLDRLENEASEGTPTPRYEAMVVGVTNRYSPNRVPFLVPLLADGRNRLAPDAADYRYCDTAAARIVSITNEPEIEDTLKGEVYWDSMVTAAREYVDQATELCQLRPFNPDLFDRFHLSLHDVGDKDDYRE